MGGHNTTSVQSSTGPVVPPPALKSKKSIDWLPKSFKRSKASGLATTAPLASSASSSQSRGSFRLSRNDFLSQKNSQTRSTDSSNSDSFLPVIPGSPRDTHSLTSTGSNDDPKSGDEICSLPSQPSPGLPLTPEDVPAVQVSNISLLSSSLPLRHSFPAHKSHETESPGLHTPTISSTSSDKHLDVPQDRPHGLAEKGTSDYEKLVLSLSSRKALRTMLDDPVGLWKFGQFLASEMNAETLVFWLNAEQHRNDLKRLYSLTQRIHSLHIPSNAPLALNITSAERAGIEKSIKSFVRADDPFKVARDAAFNALYHDAWPRFLQWRLELLHERMRNGDKVAPQTSFTLSDPSSERDQPLLLASDGFLELTGYSRDEVLMRNCRFLQGAGTSAATIARIRQACKYGQPLTELILNYRKDGVPFWSLFRLIPLRNANGKLKYLLGAQENVTNVLSATPDLAHLLADELDPCPMAPRPPFEHDLAETQMHDTGEAMRAYLKSLDRGTAPADKPIGLARPTNISPNPSQRSPLLNTGTPSPLLGPNNSAFASNATTPRPRSANRDMHLHAAAALAFDGTMGSNTARSAQSWAQAPVHGRPATSNSIFARPDTSYSMVDTQGREMAQLSLAEKTKAFNEASSHYLVLDSTCDMILFHSANLPATIKVGTAFPELVGATLAKRIKDKIAQSERVDIPLAPVRVPPIFDPLGVWREGVKLALTPLKDQINEVGAVIVLMSNTQGQKRT